MAKNKFVAQAVREVTSSKKVNKKIHQKFKEFVNKFSGKELDEFLFSVFSYEMYRNYYTCNYLIPDKIFKKNIFKIRSQKRELLWYKNIFLHNKDLINYFLNKQIKIEILILNSKGKEALDEIADVVANTGQSLWAIEYQTHIKKELLYESNITYLNELKNLNESGEMDFFVQQLTLKSESKDIKSFITNLLTQINLMRETEQDLHNQASDYADLFASLLIPYMYDSKRNVNTRTLSCMMSFPIIDQYILFKKYLIDRKNLNNKLELYEQSLINDLNSEIIDEELKNLLNEGILLENIDSKYLSIIEDYTYGNYPIVEKKLNDLILIEPLSTVFIELNARTSIYQNKHSNKTLFQDLTNNFRNLLMLKDNYKSIKKIESIAIKFNLSTWIYPVFFHLYSLINTDNFKKQLSENNMKLLGEKITPKSSLNFSYSNLFNFLNINERNLPKHRYSKTIKLNYLSKNDLYLINEEFNIYKQECIINVDYLKEKADSLINNNFIDEATIFFVEEYLKNEFVSNILPFENLIKDIEELKEPLITIYVPIIYDIYNKKINNNKEDRRRESYEDYIDSFNEFKPSKIFLKKSSLKEVEIYFLKYIAIPSIMDISSEFKSSSDLKIERLEILNILDSLIDDEQVVSEKERILDELIFEDIKASFNSSKLYVDVESLKLDNEFEYIRLFDILEATKKIYLDEDLTEEEDLEKHFIRLKKTEEQEIVMPSSEMSDIIVQIYAKLLEDFVKNENYGLNKYLSTEIRHDVFFTQLRTGFEKFNLLTEVGMDEEYEDNQFWIREYSIVSNNIMFPVLSRLNDFSKDIDTLLKEANSWFNVKDVSLNGGMFDFTATHDRLTVLRKKLLPMDSFNNLLDICILYMWELTYESSKEIKKRLEEDFKENLIILINDLYKDINELRSGVNMEKLMNAIELSKNQLSEDINIVSSWLNKVEEDTQKYNIVSIIKECSYMFRDTMVQKNIKIIINEETDIFDINLSYIEARSMMLSVYISLNNSIKYGLLTNNEFIIELDIIHIEYSKLRILIKNGIKESSIEEETKLIREVKEKLSEEYKSLSTKEGGTGVHKIYNLLSNISDRFNVDVQIKDNKFILIMEVSHEDNFN